MVVLSNLVAILLQSLAARLGLVTGKHLAQVCREAYPPLVCGLLWLLCEVSIVALDVTMVLGTAVGLNLLFGLPLLPCILLTSTDALLLLGLAKLPGGSGVRVSERVTVALLACVVFCVCVDVASVQPPLGAVLGAAPPPGPPALLACSACGHSAALLQLALQRLVSVSRHRFSVSPPDSHLPRATAMHPPKIKIGQAA